MPEPIDVFEAVRADERRRMAALIREEAGALSRALQEGRKPTSPVTVGGAFALAAFIEGACRLRSSRNG